VTDHALFFVQYALYFDAWRWCFFFALFVPIYWLSRLIVHVLVLISLSAGPLLCCADDSRTAALNPCRGFAVDGVPCLGT